MNNKWCVICKSGKKYKCPQCYCPYCSLLCFKKHQASCEGVSCLKPGASEPPGPQCDNELVKTDFIEDEELRLSPQELQKLKGNAQLVRLLKDPKLQQQLIKIDNTRERTTELQRAMLDPEFRLFADQVMKMMPDKEEY